MGSSDSRPTAVLPEDPPTDPELIGVVPPPPPTPKNEKMTWKQTLRWAYRNRPRNSKLVLGVFILLCLAAVIAGSDGEQAEEPTKHKDINECILLYKNKCLPTERCVNTEVGPPGFSSMCIPCPQPYYSATPDGIECVLDCPQGYAPSDNGETCNIDICGLSGHLMSQQQKIPNGKGGLWNDIQSEDRFGEAVAPMGDPDGNGVVDFVVGASHVDVDSKKNDVGSVYGIFLKPELTVLTTQTRIGTAANGGATLGGLETPMDNYDYFGESLGCLGDLDGDGVSDLIVGAPGDDDGGQNRGALYVLFMLATGEVKRQQKISSIEGGLRPSLLADGGAFGWQVGVVGEVDKDNGVVDVVAATKDKVYFMRLNLDGTVKTVKHLKTVRGTVGAHWTGGVTGVGDVDRNGVVDIVIGAPVEDTALWGCVFFLRMRANGDILMQHKIIGGEGNTGGGLAAPLSYDRSFFGYSVAGLGDLDGDGTPDLAVGAPGTPPWGDNGVGTGAVYILLLKSDGRVKGENVISSNNSGGLVKPLLLGGHFGSSIATLVKRGDSEEGAVTLVVGAKLDSASVKKGGAVYILKVPPGFVELCPAENEKCINSGDTYICG